MKERERVKVDRREHLRIGVIITDQKSSAVLTGRLAQTASHGTDLQTFLAKPCSTQVYKQEDISTSLLPLHCEQKRI